MNTNMKYGSFLFQVTILLLIIKRMKIVVLNFRGKM